MNSPASVPHSSGGSPEVPSAFLTETFCYYYDKVDAHLGITLLTAQ